MFKSRKCEQKIKSYINFQLVYMQSLQFKGAPYLVFVNSCILEEHSPLFQQECFHPSPLGNTAVFHLKSSRPVTDNVRILKQWKYVQNYKTSLWVENWYPFFSCTVFNNNHLGRLILLTGHVMLSQCIQNLHVLYHKIYITSNSIEFVFCMILTVIH